MIMMTLVPKLLLAVVACGISTVSAQSYRGEIHCGQRVEGDTEDPGNNILQSNRGPDHYRSFTLSQETTVTFNSCPESAAFDSLINVWTTNDNSLATASKLSVQPGHLCDGSSPNTAHRPVWSNRLGAGTYWVNLEGFAPDDMGEYSMNMTCLAVPTAVPTSAPTTRPTPAPTPAPTTQSPTQSPTPRPTTRPPTVFSPETKIYEIRGNYCPEGYGEYIEINDSVRPGTPKRFNWGTGEIRITPSHEDCARRCTNYSGRRFSGGCKSYMTGMWAGMLFCRSYGGALFETYCAGWAHPLDPGLYSGRLGETHANTGTLNTGGQCCTSTHWLIFGSEPPTTQVNGTNVLVTLDDAADGGVSASSSSTDTSANSSVPPVLLGIVIAFGALILLYAAFNCGKGQGQGRGGAEDQTVGGGSTA